MARRKTEVFSMSFLDCITCAFGSVVLVYVLINAKGGLRAATENRSLQERCLAFNAGPPIQVGPYHNFVQILQFGDRVVIFNEMIHDARIVWLDGRPHPPEPVKLWLGASRGRWEGKTLVVDTKNFNGKVGFRGTGERLHLVAPSRRAS